MINQNGRFFFGSSLCLVLFLYELVPRDDFCERQNGDTLPEAQGGSPVKGVLHVDDGLHLVLARRQDVLEPELES